MEMKTISLPKLNLLNPTLESTALKLMEEAGELAQVIGKFRGLSGEGEGIKQAESVVIEEISKELLDVAQTAVTMMFVMEDKHGIDIADLLKQHIDKLVAKKYISENGVNP
jgi:NTP pyrophosphatase (non-canonical NTP hydrolase)